MISLAQRVHRAIELQAPIAGVAIGSVDDRATWRIDFAANATDEQRLMAEAALAAFNVEALPVPSSVTPFQARRALNAAGLRQAAETAISSASEETRDAWEYAVSIERYSPFIAVVGQALGLDEGQIDQLFVAAAEF